ncbi:MAG: hypothetical protein JKY10_12045 [Cohaesibacteraceae bacterium]|nr:hypothetical protein [Cohaesibacteraceae bacterium]
MAKCTVCNGMGQQHTGAEIINCMNCGGLGQIIGGYTPSHPAPDNQKQKTAEPPAPPTRTKSTKNKQASLSFWIFMICFGGAAWLANDNLVGGFEKNWIAILLAGIVGGILGLKFLKLISWLIVLGMVGFGVVVYMEYWSP